jgi:hypothetical protein
MQVLLVISDLYQKLFVKKIKIFWEKNVLLEHKAHQQQIPAVEKQIMF